MTDQPVNNRDHLLTETFEKTPDMSAQPEEWREHKIKALVKLGYPQELAEKRVDEPGPDVFVKQRVMSDLSRGVPLEKAIKRAHKAWKRRCQLVRNEYYQITGKKLK